MPAHRALVLAILPLLLVPAVAGLDPGDGEVVVVQGAGAPAWKTLAAFEPNLGQAREGAEFLIRTGAATVLLEPDGVTHVLPSPTVALATDSPAAALGARDARGVPLLPAVSDEPSLEVTMDFVGASPLVRLSGEDARPGITNYFLGNDPDGWVRGVPHFGAVRATALYDGIDARWYLNGAGALEYDLIVAPGASVADVRLAFGGATSVGIDAERGTLVLSTPRGPLEHSAPIAYQEEGGARLSVDAAWTPLADGTFGFLVGDHDPTLPLVIDPVLAYASYLGGSGDDWAMDVDVDAAGAVYVTGFTEMRDFPAQATARHGNGGGWGDVFAAKIAPSGDHYEYLTFVGGSGMDYSYGGLDVNAQGLLAVIGATSSPDLPVANAAQPTHANTSGSDLFVFVLDAQGDDFVYSTYLGGVGSESSGAIAIAEDGSVVAAGATNSQDFPLKDALQPTLSGRDATLTRFSPTGAIEWSTFYGGSSWEYTSGVAVDAAGHAYVTGITGSEDLPLVAAAQTERGGSRDPFAAKVAPDGSALVYSTYVGGAAPEWGGSAVLDGAGTLYVSGMVDGPGFPSVGSTLRGGGDGDGYLAGLASDGALVLALTTGGTGYESGDVGVGPDGALWMDHFSMDAAAPAVAPIRSGLHGSDHWLVRLTPDASGYAFASFLGGPFRESGASVALGPDGSAYVVGGTESHWGFAKDGVQSAPGTGGWSRSDGFVVRVSPGAARPSEPIDVILDDGTRHNGPRGTAWIAWNASVYEGDAPLSGYRLYRGDQPWNKTLRATLPATARETLDSGAWSGALVPLAREPAVYYHLVAVNANGESVASMDWCIQQRGALANILGGSTDCYRT